MEKQIEKKFEEVEDNLDKVMLENRNLDTRVSTIEEKLKEQENKK
jgi:hypothetical protein